VFIMVDTIPNQTRIAFQSAGALPPHRARLPADAPPKTSGLEGDFANMIERMQRLPPRNFSSFLQPDGEDLQDRADTLRIHIRAFRDYVTAFMKDSADASWHVDMASIFIDGLFEDMIGDCCGLLEKAAEKAHEEGTYRAA
jgi:hypothetical protein